MITINLKLNVAIASLNDLNSEVSRDKTSLACSVYFNFPWVSDRRFYRRAKSAEVYYKFTIIYNKL